MGAVDAPFVMLHMLRGPNDLVVGAPYCVLPSEIAVILLCATCDTKGAIIIGRIARPRWTQSRVHPRCIVNTQVPVRSPPPSVSALPYQARVGLQAPRDSLLWPLPLTFQIFLPLIMPSHQFHLPLISYRYIFLCLEHTVMLLFDTTSSNHDKLTKAHHS